MASHAGQVGGILYIFANLARTSHRQCQLSSNVSLIQKPSHDQIAVLFRAVRTNEP
jgi:hypothetical protein